MYRRSTEDVQKIYRGYTEERPNIYRICVYIYIEREREIHRRYTEDVQEIPRRLNHHYVCLV